MRDRFLNDMKKPEPKRTTYTRLVGAELFEILHQQYMQEQESKPKSELRVKQEAAFRKAESLKYEKEFWEKEYKRLTKIHGKEKAKKILMMDVIQSSIEQQDKDIEAGFYKDAVLKDAYEGSYLNGKL